MPYVIDRTTIAENNATCAMFNEMCSSKDEDHALVLLKISPYMEHSGLPTVINEPLTVAMVAIDLVMAFTCV